MQTNGNLWEERVQQPRHHCARCTPITPLLVYFAVQNEVGNLLACQSGQVKAFILGLFMLGSPFLLKELLAEVICTHFVLP